MRPCTTARAGAPHVLAAVPLVLGALTLAGCGSSGSSGSSGTQPTSAAPSSTAGGGAPTPSTMPATSTPDASTPAATTPAAAALPASCAAIPLALIAPYVGPKVRLGLSFPATPGNLSCEFTTDGAHVLILNLGTGGTPATFATLKQISTLGGRKVSPVAGLGVDAFRITNGGAPAGMAVLTASGLLVSVTDRDTFAQDEALISKLLALY